jgi:hypothetical protein
MHHPEIAAADEPPADATVLEQIYGGPDRDAAGASGSTPSAGPAEEK